MSVETVVYERLEVAASYPVVSRRMKVREERDNARSHIDGVRDAYGCPKDLLRQSAGVNDVHADGDKSRCSLRSASSKWLARASSSAAHDDWRLCPSSTHFRRSRRRVECPLGSVLCTRGAAACSTRPATVDCDFQSGQPGTCECWMRERDKAASVVCNLLGVSKVGNDRAVEIWVGAHLPNPLPFI